MTQPSDPWYVRFPDGRVIRAANTTVLRRYLNRGRIPPRAPCRRSPDEEWVKLEWVEEFTDLLKKAAPVANGSPKPPVARRKKKRRAVAAGVPTTSGARLDPRRFDLVGSRGILREMLAALDSTLLPQKLTALVYAGFVLAILAALSRLPWPDLGLYQVAIAWVLALAALVTVTALSGVLTRMTYLELSELRPAQLREGLTGLTGRTVRLLLALLCARRRGGVAGRSALGDGVAAGAL